jgi:N-acetylglutamate synthase
MTEADRLHAALCAVWARLCEVMEDAVFERRNGYVWTVCPSVPVPQFNGVWPDDDSASSALAGALAEIAELELPGSVQVRHGRTPECEAEAERLGLMVQADMPGMLVTVDELEDVSVPLLTIAKARSADGLAQALAVAAAGFGAPPEILAPLYGLDVAGLDGLTVYIGRVGEQDVSTAVAYTFGGATGIFNVATPPEHRGRGYGAALTLRAVRDGFDAGAEFAWLQSSDIGQSVYRRLGFRAVERYLLYAAPEAPFPEL